MAKAKKIYAVLEGRKPGLYTTWAECEKQVSGFPGAKFKSFPTLKEAEAYMRAGGCPVVCQTEAAEHSSDESQSGMSENYAFVDGSFNGTTNVYGYGGFLRIGNEEHVLQGSGSDEEMASMRNVAGEIEGSLAAIKKAFELGIMQLDIYYDYMGIEEWANGGWKANKSGTMAYKNAVAQYRKDGMTINFIKVAAHTGIPGNERADTLAKEAVGLAT